MFKLYVTNGNFKKRRTDRHFFDFGTVSAVLNHSLSRGDILVQALCGFLPGPSTGLDKSFRQQAVEVGEQHDAHRAGKAQLIQSAPQLALGRGEPLRALTDSVDPYASNDAGSCLLEERAAGVRRIDLRNQVREVGHLARRVGG